MIDHRVKFYDSDADLAATAVEFLGIGLLAGERVIVVATPEHREFFRTGLEQAGIDVRDAQAHGRLSLLDAAGVLDSLTHKGALDPGLFDREVGVLVRRAASGGRGVRIFGEMVASLWERGDVVGALELEDMWSTLGSELPFALLCAYRCRAMETAEAVPSYCEVCSLHSDVVGGPPALEDAQLIGTFPCSVYAARYARRFVSDALSAWGFPQLLDNGWQIVSELAINAISHARSSFTVSLARSDTTIRIAVGDTDDSVPDFTTKSSVAGSGRGLKLVEALSVRWDHTPTPGGKLVWADVPMPHGPRSSAGSEATRRQSS